MSVFWATWKSIVIDPSVSADVRRLCVEWIEQVSTRYPEEDVTASLSALVQTVRDRTLPLKLASERALVSVLKLKTDPGFWEAALKAQLEPQVLKPMKDYVVRILLKSAASTAV
jgi:hypothetical protein